MAQSPLECWQVQFFHPLGIEAEMFPIRVHGPAKGILPGSEPQEQGAEERLIKDQPGPCLGHLLNPVFIKSVHMKLPFLSRQVLAWMDWGMRRVKRLKHIRS